MKKWIKFLGLFCFLCLFSHIVFSQTHWDSLGPRIITLGNMGADVLYADSNYLYMAGRFKTIDSMHIQGIGRWNGVKWDSMSAGIDGLQYDSLLGNYPDNTYAITTYHNKLYVGGGFSSLGKINASGIGTWNGTSWDSVMVQPFKILYDIYSNGTVLALTVINNNLYVGGEFDTVAGFTCIGIACWNDTNWSSLNFPNLADFVNIDAICEYKGSIYAGGEFYGNTPTDSLHHILRYDSTGWHAVGGGIKGGADDIWSMVVYNGELYVGGEFLKSEGNFGNNIQKWNGTSWSDVGGGTDFQIEHLMVYHGKLFAMSGFTTAGGIPANGIAEWDGSKWCSLGSTFDNVINSSCIYKDSLYIGGGFDRIDGEPITYVAEWTGGNYVANCGQPTGVNQLKNDNEQLKVYPNPSNGAFTLALSNIAENCNVEIYDVLGEKVYSQLTIHNSQLTIHLSSQPNGVYFYRVLAQDGDFIGSGKVIIQR